MVSSSTLDIPATGDVPRHVAVIMDGNGRWATRRHLPRVAGHTRGLDAVREVVQGCGEAGVEYLTLFAFSSENWRRPLDEVSFLMRLFIQAIDREVGKLADRGVRLRVVGDLSAFEPRLQDMIHDAQERTARNHRLHLTVAGRYGGSWESLYAMRKLMRLHPVLAGDPDAINERALAPYLSMAFAPEPDLFIRTGGEQRISNFLIWQLAYTELYFTDRYWPDFGVEALHEAFAWYRQRERRFGRTSAQLTQAGVAPQALPSGG